MRVLSPPPHTSSVFEATLEDLLWTLVYAMHIRTKHLLRREVFGESVGGVGSAGDVEEFNDLSIIQLLQEAAASRYVCETLDRSRVLGDKNSGFVVAPDANRLAAKLAKRDEFKHAVSYTHLTLPTKSTV